MLLAPLTHSAFICWALTHTRQVTRGGRKWVPMAGVSRGHVKTPEPEHMGTMAKKQAETARVLIEAQLLK